MNKSGKILALDFGENNVGLAETDAERMIVFPGGVISNFKSLDELSRRIISICGEKGIVLIVFGLPMGENGEETSQTERFRSIGAKLEEKIKSDLSGVEFEYIDESFSSYEGEKLGGSASGHEKAAVKILERFLEIA